MNYTLRKKIKHNLLNIITFVVVAVNLFPALWMVYTSFMNNNDITSGNVRFGRMANDAVATFVDKENQIAFFCKSNGAITKYSFDNDGLNKVAYAGRNKVVSSFAEDENYIWTFSANRGITAYDRESLREVRRLSMPAIRRNINNALGRDIGTIHVTDIFRTAIHVDENYIYVGYQHRHSPGFMVINKKDFSFRLLTTSDGLNETAVVNMYAKGDTLYVLTTAGVNLFDLNSHTVVGSYRPANRDNLIRLVPINERYFAGLNQTRQAVFIYEVKDGSLSVVRSLKEGYGIDIATISFLDVNHQDSVLYVGTFTSGRAIKIPYSFVVDLADGTVPPALEEPIENDMTIHFEQGSVRVDERFFITEDDQTIRGNVHSIFKIDSAKYLVGGNLGRLSLVDFGDNASVLATASAPPGSVDVRWRNYIDVFKNLPFGTYLKNSLIICLSVMFIAMFLASLAGYATARYKFPGKDMFGYTILATQMIPHIMFLIPIYLMFVKFNEITGIATRGTYWSVIFLYSAFFVPFSIWILRGFFASIPKELEEAALIDGCNPFQAFIKIIIPAAMPGIVATGIWVFLLAWDELMFAWVMTSEQTFTIPVGIRNFAGNYQNRYDLLMAASTIATIPVLILFFVMQKQIVSGLTAGAVKE